MVPGATSRVVSIDSTTLTTALIPSPDAATKATQAMTIDTVRDGRPNFTLTFWNRQSGVMSEVVDDAGGEHFTLTEDGHTAELVYHLNGKRLVLIHTEVPEPLEGRGIGGRLVQAALARARAEGLTIVPNCPFARSWLERHPDAVEGIDIAW